MKFRFVIPMVTIPRLDGQQIVDENRLKQLGVGAERPIHAEQDAALPFKKGQGLEDPKRPAQRMPKAWPFFTVAVCGFRS